MVTDKLGISRKYHAIFLLLVALGLNINTLFNDYALDDLVMLTQNKYVEKGIKGIPDILSTDLMSGSMDKQLLTQPRYRPIGAITFAIEYQFFGKNPFVSHLINVLLFGLLICLLYILLDRYIFQRQHSYLSFLTCLLFTVHPIHTEVIANVKSRDELITFIFIITSLIFLLRYFTSRNITRLFAGIICFFIALLTRESAITFIAVVPLVLCFFHQQGIKKSLLFTAPLLVAIAGYIVLRYWAIGTYNPVAADITNAPFLYATTSAAFATKIFILLKYMWILVFPFPLSSDYTYNQIPYISIHSGRFLIAAGLILSLLVYAFFAFKSRSLLGFCILYFMITMSLASNLVVDIGTPFSERMLFQPSLAFCLLLAAGFLKLQEKLRMPSVIALLVVLHLFSFKTIARNREWKNNEVLMLTDVVAAPNSVRTTWAAAEIYRAKAEAETNEQLKNEYLEKSIKYNEQALNIYPKNQAACISIGYSYYDQSDYDKAAKYFLQAYLLDSASDQAKECMNVMSHLFYMRGNDLLNKGNIDAALNSYHKSLVLMPNVETWYNVGGAYFIKNDTVQAMQAWNKVKQLDPSHRLVRAEFPGHSSVQ